MTKPSHIFISSPHRGNDEFKLVREAFATNWIAPLGVRDFCSWRRHYAGVQGPAVAAKQLPPSCNFGETRWRGAGLRAGLRPGKLSSGNATGAED